MITIPSAPDIPENGNDNIAGNFLRELEQTRYDDVDAMRTHLKNIALRIADLHPHPQKAGHLRHLATYNFETATLLATFRNELFTALLHLDESH